MTRRPAAIDLDTLIAKGRATVRDVNMAALMPGAVEPTGTLPLTIDVPGCVIKSEMNERCHWAVRRERMKAQKDALLLAIVIGRFRKPSIEDPVRITFTRIGGRKLDDDNLQGGFKAVRDALCGWLGIDDGRDDLLTFKYAQAKGEPGIRVEIVTL